VLRVATFSVFLHRSRRSVEFHTMLFAFILVILALIVSVYIYLTWNFDYWQKLGVPSPKARVFFGDLPNEILRKKHVCYDVDKIYK
jgi:hypothetical protein